MSRLAKSKSRLLRLAALALVVIVRASTAWAQNDIAATVKHEADLAMQDYGITASLNIPEVAPIESRPKEGLIIGLEAIRGYLAPISPDLWTYTLRFIVAHELWHQVQFRDYGPDVLRQATEKARLYECQADLMGARHVFASIQSPIAEGARAAANATLSFAASIGMPRYSPSDHPSEAQRRIAAQFGMGHALKTYLDRQPPTEETSVVKYRLDNILDIVTDERPIDWSLRECKRIIHYPQVGTASVVEGERHIHWSVSADNPIVNFSIPYRNVSTRPIRVSLEIASVMVPRSDPDNVAKRVRIETLNQTFDLPPGETQIVEGVLHWYRTEDTMPKLIVPPDDDGSLIAAYPTGAAIPHPTLAQSILPNNLTPRAAGLARVIERLIRCSPDRFAACRADAGTGGTDSISYAASPPLPDAKETEIVVDRNGSAEIQATFYDGSSLEDAQAIYSRLKTDIAAAYPDTPPSELSSNKDEPMCTIEVQGNAEITIDIHRHKKGGFAVNFTLTPTIF